MAYLELILRCVTHRGLLKTVLHFLFTYEYDGIRVVDVMLRRLDGNSQLSLVSLALMETLIDLNCEDVMIELVYKYLLNGHHLMLSLVSLALMETLIDLNCEDVMIELVYKYLLNGHHLMVNHRHKTSDPEPYRDAAVAFLGLRPKCCSRPLEKTREWVDELALSGRRILEYKRDADRRVNGINGDIAMNNLVQEVKFNYGNPNETLFGNYHSYLCDARFEIVSRTIACSNWTSKYDSVTSPKRETNNNTKETKELDVLNKEQDSLISVCTSGYGTLKTSDTSEKEPHSLTSLVDETENKINEQEKEHDSLTSIGEDSEYDSFRYRIEEDCQGYAEESFRKSFGKENTNVRPYDGEVPLVRSWRASAESIIGPLLSSLLKKAASLLESEMVVNCRVTSALTKLASLPTPLLTSLLLCPGFVLQPNVPSLFQILSKLKDELDELTVGLDNINELVDKARVYLMQREMALVRTRLTNDDGQPNTQDSASHKSDDSPFRRVESKRRSLSSSLSNMFTRKTPASPSQHTLMSLQPTHASSPQRLVFTQELYWNQSITLRSILNAVILDEWVKELASLCEEHALRLTAENYEDDTYIRTVAL